MKPRRTEADAPKDDEPRTSGAGGPGIKRAAGRQPPWDKEKGAGPEEGSFGSWLRRQRELRQVSLRDVADRTKISYRYLEAMEEDRFDILPAPVFAKGFLREYARYVGLSPDEVVNHYLAVQQAQEGEDRNDETMIGKVVKAAKAEKNARTRNWSYGLLMVLAAVLILLLVWLFSYLADRRNKSPEAEQQRPMPAMAAPPAEEIRPAALPPPAEEPKAPLEVTLDFTDECWVKAVIDGKKHIEEQRVQGESMPLLAQKSVLLTLGNAGAVDLQVNGRTVELGKAKGEVLKDLLITPDSIGILKEKKEAP